MKRERKTNPKVNEMRKMNKAKHVRKLSVIHDKVIYAGH